MLRHVTTVSIITTRAASRFKPPMESLFRLRYPDKDAYFKRSKTYFIKAAHVNCLKFSITVENEDGVYPHGKQKYNFDVAAKCSYQAKSLINP